MPKGARKPDEEPPITDIIGGTVSSKTPYSGIKSDITEEDLSNHKVAKIIARTLLGDVKRCQREITELEEFKDKYHEKNKLEAVLQERLTGLGESMSVRSLLFTVGGVVLGLLFSPDMREYIIPMGIACLACFIIALWNPKLKLFKKKIDDESQN